MSQSQSTGEVEESGGGAPFTGQGPVGPGSEQDELYAVVRKAFATVWEQGSKETREALEDPSGPGIPRNPYL